MDQQLLEGKPVFPDYIGDRLRRPHLHLQRYLRKIPLVRTLKIVEFRTDPELRRQS
jgi:hypothetical protein